MLTRSAKEEGGDCSPALPTNLIIISDVMQSSYNNKPPVLSSPWPMLTEKGNRCFVITYHFMTFCCMEVVKHIIAWLTICLLLRYCLHLCSWKSRIIIYEYLPPVELWMQLSVDSSNSSHPLHMGHGNTGFCQEDMGCVSHVEEGWLEKELVFCKAQPSKPCDNLQITELIIDIQQQQVWKSTDKN